MRESRPTALRRIAWLAATVSVMTLARSVSAEAFVDLGINATYVDARIATLAENVTSTATGLHFGAGLRRELARGSIGARVELDDVDGDMLLAVRAFDYRRHLSERFALTAFAGAARLDLATPAYGYYFGGGIQLKELRPNWALAVDVRYGDKIARDNLLPTDPQGGSPDNFYDLSSIAVYLSRRF